MSIYQMRKLKWKMYLWCSKFQPSLFRKMTKPCWSLQWFYQLFLFVHLQLLFRNSCRFGWNFHLNIRIKQIRKSDINREKLLEEKNKEIQKYQKIWEYVIRDGLSLNQASKVYGITKQILMRRFSKMHPEEYKQIFSSKRTSK